MPGQIDYKISIIEDQTMHQPGSKGHPSLQVIAQNEVTLQSIEDIKLKHLLYLNVLRTLYTAFGGLNHVQLTF